MNLPSHTHTTSLLANTANTLFARHTPRLKNSLTTSLEGAVKAATLLCALLLCLLMQHAYALPSDSSQPVRLTADKATFNENTGVTEYIGNVSISQGSLLMRANRLTVNLNSDGSIKSAQATGSPARMQQQLSANKGLSKGEAAAISYDAKTGIILLTGNASLKQDGASITGARIRYSLSAGDFEAKGSGSSQVELIIPPNPKTNPLSVR